jgi:hypothetical protein
MRKECSLLYHINFSSMINDSVDLAVSEVKTFWSADFRCWRSFWWIFIREKRRDSFGGEWLV